MMNRSSRRTRAARRAPSAFTPAKRVAPQAGAAFTLIELLVVIAIIAILAAILFPVFAQAREKARQTACLSNTKQLSLGLQMYAQDYDEYITYAINGPRNGNSASYITWDEALFPYTKSAGVYVCPSHGTPKVPSNGTYPVSFITNAVVMTTNTNGTTSAFPLTRFDAPASTIAMTETSFAPDVNNRTNYQAYSLCANGAPWPLEQVTDPNQNAKKRLAWDRHSGGANYVFLDGHAKWHRLEQTVAPTWMHGPCQ